MGKTAPLARFLATSLVREVAANEFTKPQLTGGAVLIEVVLKPGTRIAWLPVIGQPELAYQQEILVRPGMMQRIVGVDRSGSIPVVQMEVTPQ